MRKNVGGFFSKKTFQYGRLHLLLLREQGRDHTFWGAILGKMLFALYI